MGAEGLFAGRGGVMVRACLEGELGEVLVSPSGRSATAALGDFVFLAGAPERGRTYWCPSPAAGRRR